MNDLLFGTDVSTNKMILSHPKDVGYIFHLMVSIPSPWSFGPQKPLIFFMVFISMCCISIRVGGNGDHSSHLGSSKDAWNL